LLDNLLESLSLGFGPAGLDSICVDAAGRTFLTSSGLVLLTVPHLPPPLSLLSSACLAHSDHRKLLFLMLATFLSSPSPPVNPAVPAGLLAAMLSSIPVVNDGAEGRERDVVQTCVEGKADHSVLKAIGDVVLGCGSLSATINPDNFSNSSFSSLFVGAVGPEVEESLWCEGVVVSGAAARREMVDWGGGRGRDLALVLRTAEDGPEAVRLLVGALLEGQVGVVLTVGQPCPALADYCSRAGILVVSGLGKEDAERVAGAVGVAASPSIEFLLHDGLEGATFALTAARRLPRAADLVLLQGPALSRVKTGVLFGPSQPLVDHMLALARAAGAALAAYRADGRLVPGGAGWQTRAALAVRAWRPTSENQAAVLARIEDCLWAGPRALAGPRLRELIAGPERSAVVYKRDGWKVNVHDAFRIEDAFESGVVEPYRSVQEVLTSFLETALQCNKIKAMRS
jgi:hypothetical protein